jgi:hypothetical protein
MRRITADAALSEEGEHQIPFSVAD